VWRGTGGHQPNRRPPVGSRQRQRLRERRTCATPTRAIKLRGRE
jgi:hypothetical protein